MTVRNLATLLAPARVQADNPCGYLRLDRAPSRRRFGAYSTFDRRGCVDTSFRDRRATCGNLEHEHASKLSQRLARRYSGNSRRAQLIEDRKLWREAIGWIDAHLLASTLLSKCSFWTLDERLNR